MFLDISYINQASPYLGQFKWQTPNRVANCRCPICGDSSKNRYRARGYLILGDTHFHYYCHNCNYSCSLQSFLELIAPELATQYKLELFKQRRTFTVIEDFDEAKIFQHPIFKKESNPLNSCIPISNLPNSHVAVKYLHYRKQPLNGLYFTEDFQSIAIQLDSDTQQPADARIIIPFFNAQKKLIGLQGRSFDPSCKMRYASVVIPDNLFVYGMDTIDHSQQCFVLEGPLDARLLPNAVAVASSSLTRISHIMPSSTIYVWDNEPRNRQIVREMEKAIDQKVRVCIWREDWGKDINNMVVSGKNINEIIKLIEDSAVFGASAKLLMTRWQKSY